jgi:nucleoside-diphosphate-sugar epimerase
LVIGNLGYIGPVVVEHLRRTFPDGAIHGFDTGLFAGCLMSGGLLPEVALDNQRFGDVRRCPSDVFAGVDAVLYLAALSNDPIGNAFEKPTMEINADCAVAAARMAKASGVRHFVFASSCSVYGAGGNEAKDENANLAPQTAYAKSKIAAEQGLAELADASLSVTSLRFATACGFSPRLRLDLVLNDFVASALSTGEIVVLSDGSPWRPLIHVRDMARAIEWAIGRDADVGGAFLAVNTGADAGNYQIRDLAEAVAAELGGIQVSINRDASPDKRSYRVSFAKFHELAPAHQPRFTLADSVRDLASNLRRCGFSDARFRDGSLMRLNFIRQLIEGGALDRNLCWVRV